MQQKINGVCHLMYSRSEINRSCALKSIDQERKCTCHKAINQRVALTYSQKGQVSMGTSLVANKSLKRPAAHPVGTLCFKSSMLRERRYIRKRVFFVNPLESKAIVVMS